MAVKRSDQMVSPTSPARGDGTGAPKRPRIGPRFTDEPKPATEIDNGPSAETELSERLVAVLDRLMEAYGTRPWNWHTRQDAFQVLIGTVLSQRTRDEKTDEAARALFAEYPTAETLAHAPLEDIELRIRPVNYYKTKAERVRTISRLILEDFAGRTPDNVDQLMQLPGVGRKTANCVMVYGFQKAAIPVDTHVHRICNRLGVTETKTPAQTEEVLWGVLPEKYRLLINELLVKHGQTRCKPIGPNCPQCPVLQLCRFGEKRVSSEE